VQGIAIGILPTAETSDVSEHNAVGHGKRPRRNRKPVFHLAQQLFGRGAILSADDKSVIRKYENVGFLCPGHCQLDFSG
jgi:hypothetical protein